MQLPSRSASVSAVRQVQRAAGSRFSAPALRFWAAGGRRQRSVISPKSKSRAWKAERGPFAALRIRSFIFPGAGGLFSAKTDPRSLTFPLPVTISQIPPNNTLQNHSRPTHQNASDANPGAQKAAVDLCAAFCVR